MVTLATTDTHGLRAGLETIGLRSREIVPNLLGVYVAPDWGGAPATRAQLEAFLDSWRVRAGRRHVIVGGDL